MKIINICFIIFIIILLILYMNYPNRYKDFMLDESSLEKLSNKIYYLKNEYNKKRKLLNLHKKILEIDDILYYKNLNIINDNYNNSLRLINIEIEQIKNLNKIYYKKLKDLDNINNLCIIKKKYNQELYKIQDLGYIMILRLEKYHTNLLQNLYNYNITELKNKSNELYELQQNYEDDMKNINKDYLDKLEILKNKLKSKLKKKKNKCKCKLKISWEDLDTPIIKCCQFKLKIKTRKNKK